MLLSLGGIRIKVESHLKVHRKIERKKQRERGERGEISREREREKKEKGLSKNVNNGIVSSMICIAKVHLSSRKHTWTSIQRDQ